jgi:hypothetical protein
VQRAFAHGASGIGAMVDWLCAQAEQPSQVAIAIETPHGPIVEALDPFVAGTVRFSPRKIVSSLIAMPSRAISLSAGARQWHGPTAASD